MGDPEVTAQDLALRIKALLAELSSVIQSKLSPSAAFTFSSGGAGIFGGELEADLIVPADRAIIWRDNVPADVFTISYSDVIDSILFDGYFSLTGNNGMVFFGAGGLTIADTWLRIEEAAHWALNHWGLRIGVDVANNYQTTITVREDLTYRELNLAANPINIGAGAGGINLATPAGKIATQDDTFNWADLLGEIDSRQTQAEVEAIITAECAGGETIDNAIDALIAAHAGVATAHQDAPALIAAHAAVAAAHHARYADAEAVTAMGAKGDANPLHHDRYTDAEVDARIALTDLADLGDVSITGGSMEDGLMWSSGNSDYVPLILKSHNGYEASGVWFFRPVATGQVDVIFILPIPTTRGNQKLYTTGYELGIWDADGGDYIDHIALLGQNATAQATIETDGTNWNTTGRKTNTWSSAHDLSGYESVMVEMRLQITTTTDFELSFINLLVYYSG